MFSTMNKSTIFPNNARPIFQDYKTLLDDIPNNSIKFIQRATNQVAHILAKVAGSNPNRGE